MYKDIVIKKRVWMPEDEKELTPWELFDYDESVEFESTIVDFNGRIPIEEAVKVGEWVTDGFRLVSADCAEIISEGTRVLTEERIQEVISQWQIKECNLLPVAFYYSGGDTYVIEFSNGDESAIINADWFQYIYDGEYEYDLMINELGWRGLALKQDGLVCGFVMGMDRRNPDPIWERPYSLADVEALRVN